MMTPYIFGQLLKQVSKQESYFNSFLSKNKNKFDNFISISFSAKKYDDVDVHKFFYDNFKDFVINELDHVNEKVVFENWIYDLAEKRIIDIRSKVDREATRILTQKGGINNWGLACDLIKKEYRDIILKVVVKYFSDAKYKGLKEEIFDILVQQLFLSRSNPTPISSIDNYENWLYVCLKNLSNNKRKEIEVELGILVEGDISLDSSNQTGKSQKACSTSMDSVNDSICDANVITSESSNNSLCDEDGVSKSEENEYGDSMEIVDTSSEDGAEAELNRYLALMTNLKYVELIRAIKIEGVPVDVLAEEWGCTRAAIYNMMNEAMAMLSSVALPEIRIRMKKKYLKCKPYFKTNTNDVKLSDFEIIILKDLFENVLRIDDIAPKYHKSPSTTYTKMYSALNKLKKIYQSLDTEGYLTIEEEEFYKGQFWNC